MSRLVVLLIVVGTTLIPALAARDANPVRGLRRTLFVGSLFFGFYLFALLVLYPRL